MRAVWFGVLFLSGSWLFLTPIFGQNYHSAFVLLALGCGFNIVSLREIRIGKIDKRYCLLCVPLLISAFVVPFPYIIGFVFAIIGMAAITVRHPRVISTFAAGLIFSGLTLIVQSAFLPLYFSLASHSHQLDLVSPIVCYLLKILGMECTWSQNSFFVQSAKEVFEFTATLEKLGIYTWLNISLGALIVVLFTLRRKPGTWLIFILCIGLSYLVFRYVGLILLYLNFNRMNVFWNGWVSIGSFAPLILIFLRFIPVGTGIEGRPLDRAPLEIRNKRHLVIITTAFIGVFLLIGSWGFQDPGIKKKGRIIIDEKHSDWEWTTRKYDTRWFGEKSGYNYYCLWDYLNYYYKADRNFEAITSQLLQNYDILIIKTPTSKFSRDEIGNIRKFVKDGGGLFLIGDHTNVFGTSSYINPIAEQFGLRFNYDATYDLKTGGLSVYKPPRLLPHPVVQYLPPFLFGTSCTLEAPWSAEDVIVGYGLRALKLDYSQKNFFAEKNSSTNMEFGVFLQSAGVKYAKGRVLAFTDSTVFSNFWMFIPGKPELLLGSINWLNRENHLAYNININCAFFVIGLLLMGTGFVLALRGGNWVEGLSVVLFSAFLAFPFGVYFFQTLNHNNYSFPQPHTSFTKVCFELEHSDFFLPILELVRRPDRSYHTFYVWTQRLGYVPKAFPKLEDALNKGDIVIIINPVRHFTSADKTQIQSYVNRGGKLILMDSSLNENSTANELLQTFNMKIDFKPLKSPFFYDISGQKISSTQYAAKVTGGKPVLFTGNNDPVLSVRRKGEGLVVVMTDCRLFSDEIFGSTSTIPSPEQRRLYDLEFWMLKELIEAS